MDLFRPKPRGRAAWGPTNMDLLRLRRNDRAMLCWVCGVKTSDNISSSELLSKLGLVDVSVELRAKRLRWYGQGRGNPTPGP